MSIEIKGKVYRNLQEQVEKNKEDIKDLQEHGTGETYTAGSGIDITENVISVDNTVALKSELFSGDYDDLTDKPDLTVYAKLNDATQNITAYSMTATPGSGYIHTTYGASNISISIPRTPGYTLNIPTKDGTLATTDDIPSTTNFVTLDGNQTITGVKTFGEVHVTDAYGNCDINSYKISLNKEESDHDREVAIYLGNADASFIQYRKTVPGSSGTSVNNTYTLPHQDATGTNTYTLATTADIPTLSGLTMRNYKVVINDQYQYNFSVPYEFDTDLTRYDAIRKIPVNSNIVDKTNHKTGIFTWQTGTIAVIYWPDNTTTAINFTDGFSCVISANAPATM